MPLLPFVLHGAADFVEIFDWFAAQNSAVAEKGANAQALLSHLHSMCWAPLCVLSAELYGLAEHAFVPQLCAASQIQ